MITHKVLWNRWPFHVLGVIDLFHSFYHVAYLFTNMEGEESYQHLLRAVSDYYYSLTGEAPNVKYSMSDNSWAIFNAM